MDKLWKHYSIFQIKKPKRPIAFAMGHLNKPFGPLL